VARSTNFRRGLAPDYLEQIRNRALLSFLRNTALWGKGVHLQIRENYINLYYQGQSLLKFAWQSKTRFKAEVNTKFLHLDSFPSLNTLPHKKYEGKGTDCWVFDLDESDVLQFGQTFKSFVEHAKRNIRAHVSSSEAAFEQLFIEANQHSESRFLILDRQIQFRSESRLDVLALSPREGIQECGLDLIELKYGPDPRIPDVFEKQLIEYRKRFTENYGDVLESYATVMRQKIAIQKWPRSEVVRISEDPNTIRCIAVLGNIRAQHPLVRGLAENIPWGCQYVLQNYELFEGQLLP
jgi:hypothetical protein